MFKNFTKYEVFEDGKIWSYKHKKWLKPWTNNSGYQLVMLSDNEGERKRYLVHRVIYESVTGEPIPENMQVNHRNETKNDNRFENLNLLSPKENTNFGTRNERAAKTNTNGKCSKAVGAYRNDELVMSFPSTMEAHRNGFDCGNVSKCCNGKIPHYKGYTWKYI